MNLVVQMGNLTKDPEVRYANDKEGESYPIANFSMAVKDDYGNTEFVDVTTFRKTAEFVEKYFHSGSRVLVRGRIHTDKWTDEKTGDKRRHTKIVGDHVEFCEKKNSQEIAKPESKLSEDFMSVSDSELPYN